MNRFRFVLNVPAILSLATAEEDYDPDAEQVSYSLSDGRTLVLPREEATRLNLFELKPGETFGICKRYQDEKMIASLTDIWLTPQTEQARAQTEQPIPPPSKAPQPKARRRKVVEMQPDPLIPQNASTPQGTGTHGPVPIPRPKIAASANGRIPWNVAFREVAKFVAEELKAIGEQWSDQARQDAVSTILIAEAKAGRITTWER